MLIQPVLSFEMHVDIAASSSIAAVDPETACLERPIDFVSVKYLYRFLSAKSIYAKSVKLCQVVLPNWD